MSPMMAPYWITAVFGFFCFANVSSALPIQEEDLFVNFLQKVDHVHELDTAAAFENEVLPPAVVDIQKHISQPKTGDTNMTVTLNEILQKYAKSETEHSGLDMKERNDIGDTDMTVTLNEVLQKYAKRDAGHSGSEMNARNDIGDTNMTVTLNEVLQKYAKSDTGHSGSDMKERNDIGDTNMTVTLDEVLQKYAKNETGHSALNMKERNDIGDTKMTVTLNKVLQKYAKIETGHSDSDMKEVKDIGSKSSLNYLKYVVNEHPIKSSGDTKVTNEIVETWKALRDVAESLKKRAAGRINIDIRFSLGEHGDESPLDAFGSASAPIFLQQQSNPTYFDGDTMWTLNRLTESSLDTPPDICEDASLDTIVRTEDGTTYAFKGDFYWKINFNITAPGYPRKISDDWGGLEGNLDASFTWLRGKTYFFKGGSYWRFTNREMDPGFPKLISEDFKGIPDNLDAAIVWSGNGVPYFFKGKEYWRYEVYKDPPVQEGSYPAPVSAWEGLPADGVDASFVWENKKSYFFKGGQYYRFDDETSRVAWNKPPYPCSNALNWFSCPVNSC